MKQLAIFIFLFIISSKIIAQKITLPDKEFVIHLSAENVQIKQGDSLSVKVFVLKSKQFLKAKTQMSVNSELPKGIKISFSPQVGIFDQTNALILVSKEAEVGTYSLVLSSEMKLLAKGTILTIDVQK
jgi:uncharacterized 2Fe-2S/4Fe-4S cluster protein (DUF4445 family)